MQIVITPTGMLKCLYGEVLDLQVWGRPTIHRGSHVEPTNDGQWTADLSPVDGPILGPFPNRSAALNAEREWLEQNWLVPGTETSPHLSQKGASCAMGIEKDS